jgi:hypothetical protein
MALWVVFSQAASVIPIKGRTISPLDSGVVLQAVSDKKANRRGVRISRFLDGRFQL